jgi:anti-anti-sigma factor
MKIELSQENHQAIVKVIGKIHFEASAPLRNKLRKVTEVEALVLDLQEADFVGSSNIGTFYQTVKEAAFRTRSHRLQVKGASREFLRLFSLYDGGQQGFEILPDPSKE